MHIHTEPILFEDKIKYDQIVKFLLAIPIIMLVVLSILFYQNASTQEIFPEESKASSELAAIVLFLSSIFVLLVYKLVLPRSIYLFRDRLSIQYGIFHWTIPYKDISAVKAARGIPLFTMNSSVTAFGCQVEIMRKHKTDIRVCPTRREQFLQEVNRLLTDWQQAQ